MANRDNPMMDDPVHHLVKGCVDELIAFKEYRVRAAAASDPDTAKLYDKIAYEEVEHLGEFMAQIFMLDPLFREHFKAGLYEVSGATKPVEKEVDIDEND